MVAPSLRAQYESNTARVPHVGEHRYQSKTTHGSHFLHVKKHPTTNMYTEPQRSDMYHILQNRSPFFHVQYASRANYVSFAAQV